TGTPWVGYAEVSAAPGAGLRAARRPGPTGPGRRPAAPRPEPSARRAAPAGGLPQRPGPSGAAPGRRRHG
ncbi:hypothetical protein EW661_24540, partial [Escherichia coli]